MLSHTMSATEFAAAINEARLNVGLTQKELGEMAGIGEKSISKYGRAKMSPGAKTVAALNAVLFPAQPGQSGSQGATEKLALVDASVESIVDELKSRGFKQITLSAG